MTTMEELKDDFLKLRKTQIDYYCNSIIKHAESLLGDTIDKHNIETADLAMSQLSNAVKNMDALVWSYVRKLK